MSVALVDEAFSTLVQARTHLNLEESDTDLDDTICELINRTARMIQDYTGRTLKNKTYSNTMLDGTGEEVLFLPEFPITGITSIKMSATREFSSAPLLVGYDGSGSQSASAYQVVADLETGELELVDGSVWPEGRGTVRISYSAGYVLADDEGLQFVQAELLNIADWYFTIGKDVNLKTSSMGGVAETYESYGLCEKSKAILFPHRRPACVAR